MEKDPLNVKDIRLGQNGRVELNDEQLASLEADAKIVRAGGIGGEGDLESGINWIFCGTEPNAEGCRNLITCGDTTNDLLCKNGLSCDGAKNKSMCEGPN